MSAPRYVPLCPRWRPTGNRHPKWTRASLIALYRDETLTLEQLMAFAVCEDHARQEQTYAALSYNRSPQLIRRLLTEHAIEARDRRAKFIGAETYLTAGGRIRRDLFAEDHEGWFEDVTIVDQLVAEKLAQISQEIREAEGWKWAEGHADYPHAHGLRRVYPRSPEIDADTQRRLDELAEEYDRIISTCDDEDIDVNVGARVRALRKLRGLSQSALAETLGITFQQVQKYERGTNRISSSMLVKIAQTLDVPASELLGEGGMAQPSSEAFARLEVPGAAELLAAYVAMTPELRRALLTFSRTLAQEPHLKLVPNPPES